MFFELTIFYYSVQKVTLSSLITHETPASIVGLVSLISFPSINLTGSIVPNNLIFPFLSTMEGA